MISSKVNNQIVLPDLQMQPKKELPIQIRVDPGVLAIKGYSTLPKPSEPKPY